MQNVIFIFTKERPLSLKKSLEKIDPTKYKIHIIDDSYSFDSINQNKLIANSISNTAYLGKSEYGEFYNNKNSTGFGSQSWNLGNCRNFALDYAKTNNYNKVLFCDDDITVDKQQDYDYGFEILTDNFVSYNIEGMKDDSIIGHIQSSLNILDDDKFLSGGFLYLEPQKIKHKFLNIYNEDWILQMIESDKKIVLSEKKVYHAEFDPFKNYKQKILFQEYGEIFVSGLFKKELTIETSDQHFWNMIIDERKSNINLIETLTSKSKLHKFTEIVKYLNTNYNIYKPDFFETLYLKLKS
ncbi:hypothetical protein [Flavobacterium sp. UBA7682]|uniref:hypothetical protein n=1 Tax=Flavobacterium sp. UBA7682 TaxID=1946560 RepID=UPI0025BB1646|nr:hypothetical protein [Flavobacterium sp. UBA7682]